MKSILKLEELAIVILSVFLFNQLNYAWWWYLALFLTPDIGMIGYLINNKIGAYSYNLFHHKGIAIIVFLLGVYFNNNELKLAGIILLGHSAFDRILNYGLKYTTGFKHTHLGDLN